jgi:hypothetical protein
MLYPLSYEGLTFYEGLHSTRAYIVGLPSMSGESRTVGLGQATSLLTVCAAPVPRAAGQLLTSAPTCGADYTARGGGSRVGDRVAGRELEIAERLGSTINAVPLARGDAR